MEFAVRPAALSDVAEIARVHVESWKTTYAGIVPDAFLASLKVEDRIASWRMHVADGETLNFVVEATTGVFGFASGGAIRTAIPGYDAELYAIYLLRERQGQGAGRMLCRALASGLRAKGFRSMVAWALEANPSVAFYQRLGGVRVAEQTIRIGGVDLAELAFGWADLGGLA